MGRFTGLIWRIAAALVSAMAYGATPAPEGGVSILPGGLPESAGFWGGNGAGGGVVGTRSNVGADHPDFTRAIRVAVEKPTGEFWNGAIQIASTAAVAKDDVMLIRLYFRALETADESGLGFVTVFPQGPAPDFNKYIVQEITALGEWKEFLLPFAAGDALASGALSLQIGFGAGTKRQVFEIGGIELLNYGKTLALADLPRTTAEYAGRAPDAPWRAEAEARIEALRKGNLRIRVLDANGDPVSGVEVTATFLRHAFHFGSVIHASRIMGDGPDDEMYRRKVVELFNQSGPENDLKWSAWAGEWGAAFNQAQTLDALQWLRNQGMYTRGHVMVWPSKRNLPNLMQEYLTGANPIAKQVVLDHIGDIGSATAAYLDEWDVLNEPYDNHDLMDAFGPQVMVDWFAKAREVLPTQGLYLNDYSILSAGGRDAAHQKHFEDTIRYLTQSGAPITGIGMQGHFGASPTGIPLVYSILERYHDAFPKLDIRITEFDVSTDDEQLQADYLRDFLTIVFSHQATVGVQQWGFWEGQHWRPIAALYTQDWREKPAATAWKKLIYQDWWNDFSGYSGADGKYGFRAFYGDYQIEVDAPGGKASFPFTLSADGPDGIVVAGSEASLKPLSIALEAEATLRISTTRSDARPIIVETSENLLDWELLFRVDESYPEVTYEKSIDGSGSSFRIFFKQQP